LRIFPLKDLSEVAGFILVGGARDKNLYRKDGALVQMLRRETHGGDDDFRIFQQRGGESIACYKIDWSVKVAEELQGIIRRLCAQAVQATKVEEMPSVKGFGGNDINVITAAGADTFCSLQKRFYPHMVPRDGGSGPQGRSGRADAEIERLSVTIQDMRAAQIAATADATKAAKANARTAARLDEYTAELARKMDADLNEVQAQIASVADRNNVAVTEASQRLIERFGEELEVRLVIG
jgi:hypothetical protein